MCQFCCASHKLWFCLVSVLVLLFFARQECPSQKILSRTTDFLKPMNINIELIITLEPYYDITWLKDVQFYFLQIQIPLWTFCNFAMSLLMTWYMNFILIWEDYGIFRYVSYIWLPNCTISPTEKNVVHAKQLWNLKGVFLYIYCYKKIPSMHITLICFLRAIIKVTSNIRSVIPQRLLEMNTFLWG